MQRLFLICWLLLTAGEEEAFQEGAPLRGLSQSTSSVDGRFFRDEMMLQGTAQSFIGGGTRYKYKYIKIYALGMYVDREAGLPALKEMETEKKFELLRMSPWPKSMVLNFHRSVDSATVAGAIKDSLQSSLDQETLIGFHTAITKALTLTGGTQVGLKLYFMCNGNNVVVAAEPPEGNAGLKGETVVNGGNHGLRGLCGALLNVYFGNDPVAPAAKQGIADHLARG